MAPKALHKKTIKEAGYHQKLNNIDGGIDKEINGTNSICKKTRCNQSKVKGSTDSRT